MTFARVRASAAKFSCKRAGSCDTVTWLLSARTYPAGLTENAPLLVTVSCRETRSKHLVLQLIQYLVSDEDCHKNLQRSYTVLCKYILIFHQQIHITWRSWEGAMFVFEIKEQLVTVDKRNVTKFQKQLHVWSATMHVFPLPLAEWNSSTLAVVSPSQRPK